MRVLESSSMQLIPVFVFVLSSFSQRLGVNADAKVMKGRLLRKNLDDEFGHELLQNAPEGAPFEQQSQSNDFEAASAIEQKEADWFLDIGSPFHDVPPQAFVPRPRRVTPAHMSFNLQKIRKREFFVHIPDDGKKKPSKTVLQKLDADQASVARQRLTTWHCIPAHAADVHCSEGKSCRQTLLHHTCKFENIYLFCDGKRGCQLEVHTLSSNKSEIPSMSSGVTSNFASAGYPIVQRTHDSLEEFFYNTVRLPAGYLEHEHKTLTLMFWTLYHFNIGHGLFDGFYPAFVSLLQHGDQHRPFQNLLFGGRTREVSGKCPACFTHVEDVFGQIGQMGTLSTEDLKTTRDGKPTIHRFEEAVLGVGTNSAKIDMNVNYTLGACRDLDACRALRNRVYESLKVMPPVVRRDPPFHITVVFNKRFNGQWPGLVHFLQNASATESGHFLTDFKVQGVVWTEDKKTSDIHGMSHDSVQLGDFKDHIKLISETNVHISSPGTAQMYQTFLPDGAVHINMGERVAEDGDVSYMEEYMAEGAPYLRALYYPRRSNVDRLFEPRTMLTLLKEAHTLLKDGLNGPVPVNRNLSPVGKVAKAFAYYLHEQAIGHAKIPPLQRELQGIDWNGNGFPSITYFHQWSRNENTSALTSLMQLYDRGKTKFFAASPWYQRSCSEMRNRTVQHEKLRKYMDLASAPPVVLRKGVASTFSPEDELVPLL